LSVALQGSRWAFPCIETIHLLGLVAFGGALLAFTLHILGVFLPRRRAVDVLRDLKPMIAGGLIALFSSGFLLFAAGPLRFYANVAFRTKLLLIVCGMSFGICTWWAARREPPARAASAALTAVAALTAIFWFGAGIAGRMIGLL